MTHAAQVLPKRESVTQLTPGGMASLAQLTDDELLASTRRLVGKTNQLLAALLMHLAEVEVRGTHRTRSCASLYTYCIYELRFSEDAAARRSGAARFVKQFPALLDAVAAGELHLTGLLMIGPHLTLENHAEVLGRARFRTKKELAKLIRELNPLPGVPDVVQPLGPEMMRSLRNPTWVQFVESLCPRVRELSAGARPSDWASEEVHGATAERRSDDETAEGELPDGETPDGETPDGGTPDGGTPDGGTPDAELPVGPVPVDMPPVTSPQRYQLQFETVEEHVQLLERAKALMARERPGMSLGELHLEAMKLLVASLEKRKFAVGAQARTPRKPRPEGEQAAPVQPDDGETRTQPRRRGAGEPSRHIPAALQREAYERDAGRCSYVDSRGLRCCETRYLELHHLEPFAKGGAHAASNVTLRCAAHNRLAAEQDFGQSRAVARRDATRHESLARQLVRDGGS